MDFKNVSRVPGYFVAPEEEDRILAVSNFQKLKELSVPHTFKHYFADIS